MSQQLLIVLLLLFGAQGSLSAQDKARLRFPDGTEVQTAEEIGATVDSVTTVEKEFVAVYNSLGKANRLPTNVLNKLKTKNNALYKQLRSATTSYSLSQGDNRFYLVGLATINKQKLGGCSKCEVKCRVVLIEVRSGNDTQFIPIIKSIEKIRAVNEVQS